jgi:hypothetical protein
MSATLRRLVVEVFSAMEAVAWIRATAIGIASVKLTVINWAVVLTPSKCTSR